MANDDSLRLKIPLPLMEIGTSGRTRMEVQNYFDSQRKLGVSVREAIRGTEFALNLRNLQTNASGTTVTYFEESVERFTYVCRNPGCEFKGQPQYMELSPEEFKQVMGHAPNCSCGKPLSRLTS